MVVDTLDQFIDRATLGDMLWSTSGDDECLLVRLPNLTGDGDDLVILFPHHAPDNWSRPGPVSGGWNGSRDKPSFQQSILVGSWHGFVVHGELSFSRCEEPCCKV